MANQRLLSKWYKVWGLVSTPFKKSTLGKSTDRNVIIRRNKGISTLNICEGRA